MNIFLLYIIGFSLIFTWIYVVYKIKKTYLLINPFVMWNIAIGYFIVLPFSTLLFNNGFGGTHSYGQYSHWAQINFYFDEFIFPVIFIFLAVELQLIFSILLMKNKFKNYQLLVGNFNKPLFFFIIFSIFYYVMNIALIGGFSEYFSINWYKRSGLIIENYGFYGVFFNYISGCIQAIAIAFLSFQLVERKINIYTILLITLVLTNVYTSGNRIFLVILLLIVSTQSFLTGRFKVLIILTFMVPFLYLFSHYWLSVRDGNQMQDSGNISISKDLLNSENLVPKIMEVTEGANVMILLNIIKDLDSSDSYLYGETLIRPISYFIPKIIYQNRIKSFTVLTSDIYENNEEGSLSSTILGELYYNFSYFSIIFYLFLTYFFYKISYKFMNAKNNNFLFLFSSSVFIIFMARSVFSDNIIYILMLFIFSKLLKPSETY